MPEANLRIAAKVHEIVNRQQDQAKVGIFDPLFKI